MAKALLVQKAWGGRVGGGGVADGWNRIRGQAHSSLAALFDPRNQTSSTTKQDMTSLSYRLDIFTTGAISCH